MLGWFRMTSATTIEDVEWMLARSAAFDAGYSFVTSYEALNGNGFTDRILDAIGLWERARMADAFSDEQKERMEDVANEFHLEAAGPDAWQLVQVYSQVFRHERGARQPGEPLFSAFSFENPGDEQLLQWVLTAEDGAVSEVRLSIDERDAIVFPVRLREGWSLRYDGDTQITIRDASHRRVRELALDEATFRVASGRHTVTLGCRLEPADEAKARLEIRPHGRSESVTARRASRTLGLPRSR
jgi:hypothetical protein